MIGRESRTKLGINALAAGGFVVGLICEVPDLSVACLAFNCASALFSGIEYADWLSFRPDVIAEAEQITAEAAEES